MTPRTVRSWASAHPKSKRNAANFTGLNLEPEVEHEKYALDALLKRKLPYVWPGPELWRATKARWPEVFTEPDRVHLNKKGDALDAALWYEHLLRYDRGELEQSLDGAGGSGWRESVYLKENPTDR